MVVGAVRGFSNGSPKPLTKGLACGTSKSVASLWARNLAAPRGFRVSGCRSRIHLGLRRSAVHPRMIGTSVVGKPKIRDDKSDRLLESNKKRTCRSSCPGGVSAAWNLAASPAPICSTLPSIDLLGKPAVAEDARRKNLLPLSGHLRVLDQPRLKA